MHRFSRLGLLIGLFLVPFFSHAGLPGVGCLTLDEFRSLAVELAPKVNLFEAVWKQDPEAEIYGGTSRDYLFWLKSNFRGCNSHEEGLKRIQQLRSQPSLDIQEMLSPDSDVDLLSEKYVQIPGPQFKVAKIDSRPKANIESSTESGRTELQQGYIPAEKIRLKRNAIATNAGMGDGLSEIYEGKLTVHFADPREFAKTHYAKQKLNHPVLLALRYLRVQAKNHFSERAPGKVEAKPMIEAIDPASREKVRKAIESTLDGKALRPYLQQEAFAGWLNGTLQKIFHTGDDPHATLELLREFRVDSLPAIYEEIAPINQYLFARKWNEQEINTQLKKYQVKTAEFYSPVSQEFPDGFLYHGSNRRSNFIGILKQGVIPSRTGSAGEGLYGVSQKDQKFAETWLSSQRENLVRFKVSPNAKLVDITQGEGKRIWSKFVTEAGENYERFAEAFGADIIRYPYEVRAYVVKNSVALSAPEGVHATVLGFSEALSRAGKLKTLEDLEKFGNEIGQNHVTETEAQALAREIRKTQVFKLLVTPAENADTHFEKVFPLLSANDEFSRRMFREALPQFLSQTVAKLAQPDHGTAFLDYLANHPEQEPPASELKILKQGWEASGIFRDWNNRHGHSLERMKLWWPVLPRQELEASIQRILKQEKPEEWLNFYRLSQDLPEPGLSSLANDKFEEALLNSPQRTEEICVGLISKRHSSPASELSFLEKIAKRLLHKNPASTDLQTWAWLIASMTPNQNWDPEIEILIEQARTPRDFSSLLKLARVVPTGLLMKILKKAPWAQDPLDLSEAVAAVLEVRTKAEPEALMWTIEHGGEKTLRAISHLFESPDFEPRHLEFEKILSRTLASPDSELRRKTLARLFGGLYNHIRSSSWKKFPKIFIDGATENDLYEALWKMGWMQKHGPEGELYTEAARKLSPQTFFKLLAESSGGRALLHPLLEEHLQKVPKAQLKGLLKQYYFPYFFEDEEHQQWNRYARELELIFTKFDSKELQEIFDRAPKLLDPSAYKAAYKAARIQDPQERVRYLSQNWDPGFMNRCLRLFRDFR